MTAEEHKCCKCILRVVSILMMIVGLAGVGLILAEKQGTSLLGDWEVYGVLAMVAVFLFGVLGLSTACCKCGLLSLVYFCLLLLGTVVYVWAIIYAIFNTDNVGTKLRIHLDTDWPKYSASMPADVKLSVNCTGGNVTTLTDPCWEEIQSYVQGKNVVIGLSAFGIVVLQLIMLYATCKIIGTVKSVNTIALLMDTVMLLLGVAITIVGFTAMPEGSTLRLVIIVTGVTLLVLSTVFGSYCAKLYEVCGSCNAMWAMATILYAVMAIIVLALGIITLTHSETVDNVVKANMDKVCDTICMDDLKASLKTGLISSNPKCDGIQSTNGTVLNTTATTPTCPDTLTPEQCYMAAVAACDIDAAARATFMAGVQESTIHSGWALILSFLYLLIQIACKWWKWKREDKHQAMSYDGDQRGDYQAASPHDLLPLV